MHASTTLEGVDGPACRAEPCGGPPGTRPMGQRATRNGVRRGERATRAGGEEAESRFARARAASEAGVAALAVGRDRRVGRRRLGEIDEVQVVVRVSLAEAVDDRHGVRGDGGVAHDRALRRHASAETSPFAMSERKRHDATTLIPPRSTEARPVNTKPLPSPIQLGVSMAAATPPTSVEWPTSFFGAAPPDVRPPARVREGRSETSHVGAVGGEGPDAPGREHRVPVGLGRAVEDAMAMRVRSRETA